jgi:TPR repeat protein
MNGMWLGLAVAGALVGDKDGGAVAPCYADASKAEDGDPAQQSQLGYCYFTGSSPYQKDELEAVKWYKKSAAQNYSTAQLILGSVYASGFEGLERDYAEAVRWYRLSATQGNMYAQHNLGTMYQDGVGVEQNLAEAVKFFRLAAAQSQAESQYALGFLHLYGIEVANDPRSTYAWCVFTLHGHTHCSQTYHYKCPTKKYLAITPPTDQHA